MESLTLPASHLRGRGVYRPTECAQAATLRLHEKILTGSRPRKHLFYWAPRRELEEWSCDERSPGELPKLGPGFREGFLHAETVQVQRWKNAEGFPDSRSDLSEAHESGR